MAAAAAVSPRGFFDGDPARDIARTAFEGDVVFFTPAAYNCAHVKVCAMYDFTCEHCGGMVRERRVDREALPHKRSFVILEDVPVGVCDKCGARYFDASILRRVAEIGRGSAPPLRTMVVPVDRYASA
jgi:YgiT-type zinc finger domain-containing protein